MEKVVERQFQAGQQQNKWHRTLSFGKKLIAETVLTSLLLVNFTGCATAGNNTKNIKRLDTETKKEEMSKPVSAEKRVCLGGVYSGKCYNYKIESKDRFILEYWDGTLTEKTEIKKFEHKGAFGGDFKVKEFIFGNLSIMWIVVDVKGNYGFIIQTGLTGKVKYQNIRTELPVKKLKELGITLEVKYDKEKGVFVKRYIDKSGKILRLSTTTEGGKIEDDIDYGLDELLLSKK